MKIIIRGRNQGKTELLVNWVLGGRSIGEKRVLLVCSLEELYRLRVKYGLRDEELYTIGQWQESSRYGKGKVKVAIDNVELGLAQIIRNVEMISLTETGE